MNRQDRAKVVGMVLGDGYIRTASAADKLAGRRIAAQISFSHSIKQREYAACKVAELNEIFGGKATLREKKYDYVHMCHAAKSNPYFKILKGMMYKDGKKHITRQVLDMLSPEGIAFWFMDDGSYRINRASDGRVTSLSLIISTYCSKEEVDEIIAYFKREHSITFKPAYCERTTLWYVRGNTAESKKFAALISKYIVPSMRYKLACIKSLDSQECQTPNKICSKCYYVQHRKAA